MAGQVNPPPFHKGGLWNELRMGPNQVLFCEVIKLKRQGPLRLPFAREYPFTLNDEWSDAPYL